MFGTRVHDFCPIRDLVIIEPTCMSPDPDSDFQIQDLSLSLNFQTQNFFQPQIFLNHCFGA